MYKDFFGLKHKPFHIVPNPNFLYLSPQHRNALACLEYGLNERTGFVLLSGDVGAGKTTLVRHLLNRIDGSVDVAQVFHTHLEANDLIKVIAGEFGVTPGPDKSTTLERLHNHLIARFAERKPALLLIDEAQNLSPQGLEEVRMLSNLQTDQELLLQIMLVGQPELRTRLKQPELWQLSQRISVNYHLTGLRPEETQAYIRHRLGQAGSKVNPFSLAAMALIHAYSNGFPRIINTLCDNALVYGYAANQSLIDANLVMEVARDRDGIGLCQPEQSMLAEILETTADIADPEPLVGLIFTEPACAATSDQVQQPEPFTQPTPISTGSAKPDKPRRLFRSIFN